MSNSCCELIPPVISVSSRRQTRNGQVQTPALYDHYLGKLPAHTSSCNGLLGGRSASPLPPTFERADEGLQLGASFIGQAHEGLLPTVGRLPVARRSLLQSRLPNGMRGHTENFRHVGGGDLLAEDIRCCPEVHSVVCTGC